MNSYTNLPSNNLSCLYLCGIIASNSVVSNTILNFTGGQCRDSNNAIDITVPSGLSINFNINGPGGLDKSVIGEGICYGLFVIADSTGKLPVAMLASNIVGGISPVIPFGYNAYRLVGMWNTSLSTATLLSGYIVGFSNDRKFVYSTPYVLATNVHPTTYTSVSLPIVNLPTGNITVNVLSSMALIHSAGDSVNLNTSGTTDGDQITRVAPGTTMFNNYDDVYTSTLTSDGQAQFFYKVSSSLDNLNLSMLSYSYSV